MLWVGDFAHTTDDRDKTTHEDSTTLPLQPCRTAAVVGYIMYVSVASPRYAEASCFRLPRGDDFESDDDQNNPAYFFLNLKGKQQWI